MDGKKSTTRSMQVTCAIASVWATKKKRNTVKLLNNILSSTFSMMMMNTLGYFVAFFQSFFPFRAALA